MTKGDTQTNKHLRLIITGDRKFYNYFTSYVPIFLNLQIGKESNHKSYSRYNLTDISPSTLYRVPS